MMLGFSSIDSKMPSPNIVSDGGAVTTTATPMLEELTNGTGRLFLLDAPMAKRENDSVSIRMEQRWF
jgi:hypothetical protein